MVKKIAIVLFFIMTSCNFEKPTQFSTEALQDTLYDVSHKKYSFQQVLEQYKGKKIVIDVWASWCRDCVRGLPQLKELQRKFPEVTYLFLSVDTNVNSWKRGIQHYQIKGEHYNLPKGMKKGALVDFLNVSWIPRYVVIDENGKITLFKATKASDKNIEKVLKNS
ncbi:TlpA disulfide reductase family protein [uncultured Polaribacter sp.]|uniref:TlpA family protein disulfide reductase n=1 Tax=uncultured Polaribacter sp. TaxID=174711 RepID=UPI002630E4A0|nr:TlpA disulfide reductase family protein [uncultured Polaribacter sp.]